MTDHIATTGPRLKAERERRGLSLQKAADELHLDGWVIDALETENYARIGPSVYAKGHLKRYAALLGLPLAEIMTGYEARAQAPTPAAAQSANVRLHTDAAAESNLPWPQIAGAVTLGLLIAGLLWWKPWHHRAETPVSGEAAAAHASTAPADSGADSAGAAGAAAEQSTTPASSTASSASSPPAPDAGAATSASAAASSGTDAAGSGHARLRLSFSADSWVDVHDAAGRRAFAGNGRANSVRNIDGLAPMRVYLGFASGVQLEINNRAVAIGPQFVAGDVARFEAGADGVLRRDSRNAAASGPPTRSARPSN
jgi:cytoskeleton protein RodZ